MMMMIIIVNNLVLYPSLYQVLENILELILKGIYSNLHLLFASTYYSDSDGGQMVDVSTASVTI